MKWQTDDAFPDHAAASRPSVVRNLLKDLSEAAVSYGASRGQLLEDLETDLSHGLELLDDLIWAAQPEGGYKTLAEKLNFWVHTRRPLEKVRRKEVPRLDRDGLEVAAGRYLRLPYRCSSVDRLLVDMLVAMELYSFADEMVNEDPLPFFPALSPLKQRNVIWSYFIGQTLNAVVLLGLAAVVLWATAQGRVGDGWGVAVASILAVIFAALLAIGTIALPFALARQLKARRKVATVIDRMVGVYAALISSGPISALHVRDQVQAAATEGIVWPAPLYALLDDVVAREGRM